MLIFLHRPGQGCLGETPKALNDPESLNFLDPATFELRREDGRLQCRLPGQTEWTEAKLLRMFPHTLPREWIAVLGPFGKEQGVLLNLEGMSRENRDLVLDELDRRYLTTRIVRLLSGKRRFDVMQWTAETARGKVSFITRGMRDQMQQPMPGYVIFSDVEGNRYEIPDVTALDPASRRLLEEQM